MDVMDNGEKCQYELEQFGENVSDGVIHLFNGVL